MNLEQKYGLPMSKLTAIYRDIDRMYKCDDILAYVENCDDLTKEQYEMLSESADFVEEVLERFLGKCDSYWDSYWGVVEDAVMYVVESED